MIFLQIKEQLEWQLANMSGEGEREEQEAEGVHLGILALSRFIDKQIRFNVAGERKSSGLLKG